jgi:hypothetical protein
MFARPRVFLQVLGAVALTTARADEFDRLEGPTLAGVAARADVAPRDALSVAEIGNLPRVFHGLRGAVLVARTGEGNLARMVVSPALRKPPGGKVAEAVPILVLERFDTFEAGPSPTRLAKGRDMILFDGFQYDLDSGQVVPDGQGGDLRFVAGDGGKLLAISGAAVFTLTESPLSKAPEPGKPSPGKAVLPGDFAGRYHLVANGQWSGLLELRVEDQGVVKGRFRSDQTGGTYDVSGQIQSDKPGHVLFTIEFPRSKHEYDARLWTEGKGAMSGTVALLDSTFGFVAVREGARIGTREDDGDGTGRP